MLKNFEADGDFRGSPASKKPIKRLKGIGGSERARVWNWMGFAQVVALKGRSKTCDDIPPLDGTWNYHLFFSPFLFIFYDPRSFLRHGI